MHAVPLRLRNNVLGAMGLFGTRAGALNNDDLRLAQALAYVASVALVQDKAAADITVIGDQLQTALDSRVVLEQAKGGSDSGVRLSHTSAVSWRRVRGKPFGASRMCCGEKSTVDGKSTTSPVTVTHWTAVEPAALALLRAVDPRVCARPPDEQRTAPVNRGGSAAGDEQGGCQRGHGREGGK